ncbi:MAG: hypothetical protein EOP21_07245, partial [Hyphomicrobiales bacterium]
MNYRAPNRAQPGSLPAAFLADLLADWQRHGRDALAAIRTSKPERYARLAVATLRGMPDIAVNP